jgi:hypothetical protein
LSQYHTAIAWDNAIPLVSFHCINRKTRRNDTNLPHHAPRLNVAPLTPQQTGVCKPDRLADVPPDLIEAVLLSDTLFEEERKDFRSHSDYDWAEVALLF